MDARRGSRNNSAADFPQNRSDGELTPSSDSDAEVGLKIVGR